MGIIISSCGIIKAKWDNVCNKCYITFDDKKCLSYSLSNINDNNIFVFGSHQDDKFNGKRNSENCKIMKVKTSYLNTATYVYIIFQHLTPCVIKRYAYHTCDKMYLQYKMLMCIFCVDIVNIIMSNIKVIEFSDYYMNMPPKFVMYGSNVNIDDKEQKKYNKHDRITFIKRREAFTNVFRNHFKNVIINHI